MIVNSNVTVDNEYFDLKHFKFYLIIFKIHSKVIPSGDSATNRDIKQSSLFCLGYFHNQVLLIHQVQASHVSWSILSSPCMKSEFDMSFLYKSIMHEKFTFIKTKIIKFLNCLFKKKFKIVFSSSCNILDEFNFDTPSTYIFLYYQQITTNYRRLYK
jgi:hypothetical protein